MKTSKIQGGIIIVGIILIQLFYFGFDTIQLEDDSNQPIGEVEEGSIDIAHEIEDEISHLSAADKDSVNLWMSTGGKELWDQKQLAAFWTAKGKWVLAGYYTEQIALQQPSAENFAVAANTYATGLSGELNPEKRTFLSNKALSLYDSAIENSEDSYMLSLNKTLLMINYPQGNPMSSIQALMKLSTDYPDRPQAFFHLGRLAIQTQQWDKAKSRLERAYELNPMDQSTICLLVEVYTALNESTKKEEFTRLCNQ